MELYEKFQGYLREDQLGEFQKRSFQKLEAKPESNEKTKPELIATFVEQGGVIQDSPGSWNSEQFGAVLFDHSKLGAAWRLNEPYPEDSEFPFEQSERSAQRIIAFVDSSACTASAEAKDKMLNTAADLTRYTQKLGHMLSYGLGSPQHQLEWEGEGITSIKELIDRIEKLPSCSYRDRCIDTVFKSSMSEYKDYRKTFPFEPESAKRMMKLYSPDRLRKLDIENSETGFALSDHPISTLPLSESSYDASEMFPFKWKPNDHFLDPLRRFAQILDQEFETQDTPNLRDRLDQAINAVSHSGSVKDFLIERSLLPLVKGDERYAEISPAERLALLQKAYEVAGTARTQTNLGKMIAEQRLGKLGHQVTFEQGLQVVLDTMPNATAARDQLLEGLLNSTYTTWHQIYRAKQLILGHDYRTDQKDRASRNAISEAVAEKIGQMNVEERVEMMTFLLDTNKHVLTAEDLTPEFFDEQVKQKLKTRLVGKYDTGSARSRRSSSDDENRGMKKLSNEDENKRKYSEYSLVYEFTEESFDTNFELIRDYLIDRYQGENDRELTDRMYTVNNDGVEVINAVRLPEVLRMVIPDTLNDFFQKQLGASDGYQDRTVSATSLGPLFISSSPDDRRQFIYRLCLGENGFFEDKNFAVQGRAVLDKFLSICTTAKIPSAGETNVKQQWEPSEIQMVGEVLISAFENMPAGRRTELFSRIINLIADSGGQVTKEQVIKIGLTAFGVVGAKIGQMNVLIPEYLRDSLGSLKEDVAPIPKTTVAQVMEREGRTHQYEGLGPCIGGASTAAVYSARRQGFSSEDVVVKMLRPDALKNVDVDLQTAQAVITALTRPGKLNLDPTQIMTELKTMIAEEFNPKNELKNMQSLQEARHRTIDVKRQIGQIIRIKQGLGTPEGIKNPQPIYAGDWHLEMSRATGLSIAKVEQIQEKAGKNEPLTEDEARYLALDWQKINAAIVSDFFHQAFEVGVFHTDLHGGNVLIAPDGTITEIDHGQVGKEELVDKRRSLVKYTIGVSLREPKLVAGALHDFAPETNITELETFLASQPDLINGTTKALSTYSIPGSINRFIKAMINVYPYIQNIQEINPQVVKQMIAPYMLDAALVFDIEKTVPGILSGPVKEVVARKTSEIGGYVDRALVRPASDIFARIEAVRQDPEARELFDALIKTGMGSALLGAEVAQLLRVGGNPTKPSGFSLLRSVSSIVRLTRGGNEQDQQLLREVAETSRQAGVHARRIKDSLIRIRNRRLRENEAYSTNQTEIKQAAQVFDVSIEEIT